MLVTIQLMLIVINEIENCDEEEKDGDEADMPVLLPHIIDQYDAITIMGKGIIFWDLNLSVVSLYLVEYLNTLNPVFQPLLLKTI